jgi:hypothetical protein
MNGTTSGHGNGYSEPQAIPTKVQLETNVPFHAKLKFATGLLCKSQYPNGADQMLFTLTDDRKLYVPLTVAETMQRLGGQEFIITKKQALSSRKTTWVVNRAAAFTPDVHQAIARRTVEPAYDDGEYSDTPPPSRQELRQQQVRQVPAPQPQPAAEPSPSRMTTALKCAIDSLTEAATYAKEKYGIPVQFNEEDIRCIASTLYIQNSRSGQ